MYVLLIQIFYWIFTEYQTQRSTGGLTDSLGLHKLVTEGFTSVIYYPKLNSNERGGEIHFLLLLVSLMEVVETLLKTTILLGWCQVSEM